METRRATRADLEDIAALLEASSLPPLPHDSYPSNVLVVLDCREVVAAVAIEVLGRLGLLGSLVVAPEHRDKGIRASLVRSIQARAHELGLQELYVLTEDGADIFEALGFDRVERSEVPNEIRRTQQFREQCPETAVVMSMPLATRI